jgi:CheY-like chemotaxis protein
MTWIDTRVISERKQHRADRPDERRVVAARQVGAADRPRKQRVAHEEVAPAFTRARHLEADPARAMPRGVMRPRLEVSEPDGLAGRVVLVHRRRRLHVEPEHPSLLDGLLIEEEIVAMQMDGRAKGVPGGRNARDVVDVSVREQDVPHVDALAGHELDQPLHFVAGIDDDALARAPAGDHEAVLVEGGDRLRLDYDHAVILAILDDLLFTSKIRSTAAPLGVTVSFARSSPAALEQMRANRPSLVIFDLNNPRTDPMGTLAAMRADPLLNDIPTLGYVSHVDTATIAAARAAGAGEVVARSAFNASLPEILSRGR